MKELFILWTNADINTSKLMVFMYAGNSKRFNWWDKVNVIIWGATAKLCMENEEIQQELKELMEQGVNIIACKACADELSATPTLEKLGISIEYYGVGLTNVIQNPDVHLITV